MKLYIENDGWDWMRGDMVFTAAMLKASVVHATDADPLTAHVAAWQTLDGERSVAKTAVVEANARVAWMNLTLDAITTRFGGQLLVDCNQDRKHPTYVKFFPSPVNELVRMGLDAQVEAMKHFPLVAAEVTLSKTSSAVLGETLAALDAAKAACAARTETATCVTRVSLKQDAWRDEANKRRRATENALDAYATANDLARSYPDGFFAPPKPARRASAPTESELVLALPEVALRALASDYIATLPADTQAAVRTRIAR